MGYSARASAPSVSAGTNKRRTVNIIDKIIDDFRCNNRRPWRIARHPHTGKWHAIDRVLRCPITDGHDTEEEAYEAWLLFEAHDMACRITSAAELSI